MDIEQQKQKVISKLEISCAIVNCLIFTFTLFINIVVVKRTKCNIDRLGIVSLITFGLLSLLRSINWILNLNEAD